MVKWWMFAINCWILTYKTNAWRKATTKHRYLRYYMAIISTMHSQGIWHSGISMASAITPYSVLRIHRKTLTIFYKKKMSSSFVAPFVSFVLCRIFLQHKSFWPSFVIIHIYYLLPYRDVTNWFLCSPYLIIFLLVMFNLLTISRLLCCAFRCFYPIQHSVHLFVQFWMWKVVGNGLYGTNCIKCTKCIKCTNSVFIL